MIESCYEKIVRFVKGEAQWRFSVWIIIFSCLGMSLEKRILDKKLMKIEYHQKRKDLIAQIPRMEEALRVRENLRAAEKARLEQLRREDLAEIRRQEALKKEAEAARREPEAPLIKEKDALPVLEGITAMNGSASALINGEIYQEGQLVDGFLVVGINSEFVVLKNYDDGKIYQLHLFE